MALNYAEQWSPELLEILMQGTLTSPFVTSNVRWLDAKTFHFTQMSTSGYKNHSREGGWNKGTYTQTDVPYTLTHDRDVEFMVDKADVDETNATASIQNISRVFEQTWVVPETDALFFSISVVDDAKLTQQQVFDLLTNNGETQGIYIYNGKIYLNGTFLKSKSVTAEQIDVEDLYALAAKIGGWTINDTGLQSKAGKIKLLADGRIQIGNVILASDGDAFTVKNGLHIYAGTDTISDGTDKFKVFNLSHVTSGGHLVFASDGATVSYLSSSSKRYKDHVSDMTIEEAEKLLKIPVIWFKYKKGYLDESDWLNGKRLPGFYAEDIYDIFPEAAQLDEAGKPEDWNFRVMIPAILKLVQSQNERINNLCQRISKLEQLMEDKNE